MTDANSSKVPPQAALMGMTQEFAQAKALHLAAELGIADCIGDGEKTADDVARDVAAHPDATYRLLRALATRGLWEETSPRRFRLLPMGHALRKDAPGSMRDYVLYALNDDYVRIWNQLRDAIRSGAPIFEKVMGISSSEHFSKNRSAAETFSRAMTALSAGAVQGMLAAYDFSGIGSLLDVGGGHGLTVAEILRAHPKMRGAVLDLPMVTPGARALIAERVLEDRCQIVEGSFFDGIPAGYDAYFMKAILHGFDDQRARAILHNVRRVIGPSGRLLVADFVLPPGNAPHPGKWLDLHMLVMAGGRERTEQEFASLFASAGFKLGRVVPTGPTCLVEGFPI